jgi:hypothetical protein
VTLLAGDLTTLAAVQSYVTELSATPSAPVAQGLISRISMMIRGCLNRPYLFPRSYTRQFDGTGTQQLVLPDYPLIGSTLSSLFISGVPITLSPQPSDNTSSLPPFGYRFQPWDGFPPGMPAVVELLGTLFFSGRQNVVASYTAGYQVTGEAQTIPGTPYQITPLAPFGTWATDAGVTFAATGAALTAIASGTPTAGQYLPPAPDLASPRLSYTFAAADTTKGVLLNYGFIPSDIEQVVLELIAERASYRRRVGLRSQSLASQESFTYEDSGLSKWAVDALYPYISVLPPPVGASV